MLIVLTFFPKDAQASERTHIETVSIEVTNRSELLSQADLEALVAYYSTKWGVSYVDMLATVQCEAKKVTRKGILYYQPSAQSDLLYSFTDERRGIYEGQREMSFGLAQWHLPDHDITKEQAQDKDFALNRMAEAFSKGKASWWTCYRNL